MEEDKFMLTKRLNSVLEQLEAAHREKEEVDRKLQEKSQTVLDLEKQIENNQFAKESLDSNLDLEVSKEREQHQLLQNDLARYTQERDNLKAKLEDLQNQKSHVEAENERLNNEYFQKTKELKSCQSPTCKCKNAQNSTHNFKQSSKCLSLEEEFVQKQSKLTQLERELESLKNYYNFSREERTRLEEEIERLNIEKRRLLATIKHDKESEDKENHQQRKLTAAKLIALKIHQISHRSLIPGLNAIKRENLEIRVKQRALRRLEIFANAKIQMRLRRAIKIWYLTAYDFTENTQTVLQLSTQKADFKVQSKFFYAWRSAYFHKLRQYDSRLESFHRILAIAKRKEATALNKSFVRWKDNTEWATKTRTMLKNLVHKSTRGLKLQSLHLWIDTLRGVQEKEKYDALRNHITGVRMKQKIFYAWKLVTLHIKHTREIDHFEHLKLKCETKRKTQQVARGSYLVNFACTEKQKYLILKAFTSLKRYTT